MKSIRESCIELLKSEDTQTNLREIIKPINAMIYNEVYPYLWLLCIYIVVLTFIILVNLWLLIRVINNLGGLYVSSELYNV
jgi:hypothetical protein